MKTASYIEVKVFDETQAKHEKFRFQAERGRRYDADGAKREMSAFVSDLQDRVPDRVFKVITVAFNKFNVVTI